MRTLVTGGAGFIGSHLVERLIAESNSVTVLDNFSTGRLENLRHVKNSGEIRINPKLVIHQVDITKDTSKLNTYFKGVDWVFHLAALADIVPSISNPLAYHHTNVDGTVNVLEASRKAKVKRFIYAASSSCYGIPATYPTSETAPVKPQYPYALTKWIGEQYVLHWGKVFKLPVFSLRLFNVYGPRSRTNSSYGAVFGVFLAQKIHQKPFTVVGDGTQSRDFTFVTDVVEAFVLSAQSTIINESMNVGTGKAQSVNTLVKLLGGKVEYIPKRPGEPNKTQADIRKIIRLLNWKPVVQFEEGIKIMLKNIEYWKRAPVWTPKKINRASKEWFTFLK